MKTKKLDPKKEAARNDSLAQEEKESFEERTERDITAALHQEQQQIQGQTVTSSPEDRYNEVIQAAQRRVMNTLEKLENRLAKREMEAVNSLTALSMKRPGRIARFLTKGKAMKTWSKTVKNKTRRCSISVGENRW